MAYHAGAGKQSNARRIAAGLIPAGAIEEELRLPGHHRHTDHPGGYAGAMAEFYEQCAARLAAHLEAGRTVVLLAEGDPLFYGSYMYMHDRLVRPRFPTEVVPGVPAFAAATAAVAAPLVRQTDVLTILPGTLPEPELARRLADTDGAIIMKLGRTFPAVRSALEQAGRLEHAVYVERASMPAERWLPVADVDPATVPYFSLIVVPGDSASRGRADRLRLGTKPRAGAASATRAPRRGTAGRRASARARRLADPRGGGRAGRGGPRRRLRAVRRPGAAAGGAAPARVGQHRRDGPGAARARPGRARASGSPSCPAATRACSGWRRRCSRRPRTRRTPRCAIRVLPGLSAVQAVAARAGAPIGGDFAVLSLSDRLKPWSVIERAAARGRRGRPRAGDLQPGLAVAHRPGRRTRAEAPARAPARRTPWSWSGVTSAGPGSPSTVTTLARARRRTSVDMKCLLIVGASSTRRTASGRVWTPRFVG